MEAAGNGNVGTGSVCSGITQQVYGCPGQVVAIPDPLQGRRSVHQPDQMRMLFSQRLGHFRFNITRRNGVTPNSLRGQFDAERRAQHLDCAFGGVVSREAVPGDSAVRADRCNEDKASTGALFLHLLCGQLGCKKCTSDLYNINRVLLQGIV